MLDRFNGDVLPFGSSATGTERTVFGNVTQSDDINDNINADYFRGWGIVGVNDEPTKQDFNAMAYTNSYLTSYLYQQGVPTWNTNQKYYLHSRAVGSNGIIYKALTGTLATPNVGNDPVGNATNWAVDVNDSKLFAIATGTANAITATIPAITEYAKNSTFRLKATATNTGATTIKLNGLGVKNVVIDNVALVGGEIVSGSEYFFTYSSNGNFELTSLGGASTSGVTQTAYSQLITSGTSSATIPYDTSVPQQTEGVEILTCSITPASATSNLLITVRTFVSETVNTGNRITGALFRDSTTNAIASSMAPNNETAISAGEIVLQIRVPSNSTAPTTFKLRVGNDIGDVRWNGYLGVQYYGNTNITSIHIQEEN